MKLRFRYLLVSVVVVFSLISCMEDFGEQLEEFATPDVTLQVEEQGNDIRLKAKIVGNEEIVVDCGFYYSKSKDLSEAQKVISTKNEHSFSTLLELREYDQTFYCSSFVSNGTNEILSDVKNFKVNPIYSFLKFDAISVKSYDASSATIQAELSIDKGVILSSAGFCYGEEDLPSISGTYIECEPGTTFSGTISGLDVNTLYNVRAFVRSGDHIAYSQSRILKIATHPTVSTVEVVDIEPHNAILHCATIDDGGTALREMGAVWSSSNDIPVLDDKDCASIKSDTLCIGDYSVILAGLEKETLYYARAYAINDEGVSYGDVLEFSTLSYTPPIIANQEVTNIAYNKAKFSWSIKSSGGPSSFETGFILSLDNEFDLDDDSIIITKSDSVHIGVFEYEVLNLTANTVYYIRSYAINDEGISYGDVISFNTLELPESEDLSSVGVANSYIVSCSGVYKFKAVKGNSDEQLTGVSNVKVLWESSVYSDGITKKGDLIDFNNIFYADGYVIFATNEDFKKGNALISVQNDNGENLWSWHLWLTDQPAIEVYSNSAGEMMDRNLGAISSIPGDVGALGLLYQWGRKDPFLGAARISKNEVSASEYSWPSVEISNSTVGTIQYSILNPMTFISAETENNDWVYAESSISEQERWGIDKTIYDPCPYGWRVPDGGIAGVWSEAFNNCVISTEYRGLYFSTSTGANDVWYPAAGYKSYIDGDLENVGNIGIYWSSTLLNKQSQIFKFDDKGEVFKTKGCISRASGHAVRCIKDVQYNRYKLPKVGLVDITNISDTSAVVAAEIYYSGTSEVTSAGVVWSKTNSLPTLEDGNVSEAYEKGKMFKINISNLEPETKYYIRAYAKNSSGVRYSEVKYFTTETNFSKSINLSEDGTANCYIVSEGGKYRIKMVKGNSQQSVGKVSSATVLWESYGTSVAPVIGSLINPNLEIRKDYIIFSTGDNFSEGNAVIAAKDSEGKILWSWHIWLTDQPAIEVYSNSAGEMMDRNLGAISSIPGDVGALGLLYQWGRKDPFLGASSIDSNQKAASTITWPSAVVSNSTTGQISYTIANPTTYIKSSGDWSYYNEDSESRWAVSIYDKSIYDPCPPGWRVPDGGSNGVWQKAGFKKNTFNSSFKGMFFDIYSPAKTWYPAAGDIDCNTSILDYAGVSGLYWSASAENVNDAYYLLFSSSKFNTYYNHYKANGLSVRCVLMKNEYNGNNKNEGLDEEDEYEW